MILPAALRLVRFLSLPLAFGIVASAASAQTAKGFAPLFEGAPLLDQ